MSKPIPKKWVYFLVFHFTQLFILFQMRIFHLDLPVDMLKSLIVRNLVGLVLRLLRHKITSLKSLVNLWSRLRKSLHVCQVCNTPSGIIHMVKYRYRSQSPSRSALVNLSKIDTRCM